MKYLGLLIMATLVLAACTAPSVPSSGDAKSAAIALDKAATMDSKTGNNKVIQPETATGERTCFDSDGGQNKYVSGSVSGLGGTGLVPYEINDSCESNSDMREWYCNENNEPRNVWINCMWPPDSQNRNFCRDGKCVAIPSTCSDTDGGVFPEVFGSVTGFFNGLEYNYSDTCDGNSLMEWSCNAQGSRIASYFDCNGGCNLGACNPYVDVSVDLITVELLESSEVIQGMFVVTNLGTQDLEINYIMQQFDPLGLNSNTTFSGALLVGQTLTFTGNMSITARGTYEFVFEAYATEREADYRNNKATGTYTYNPVVNDPTRPVVAIEQ